DPDVADAFLDGAPELLAPLEQSSVWESVLEAEPVPRLGLPAGGLDAVTAAFGDFVDLKSPFTLGPSSGVARLPEAAGDRPRPAASPADAAHSLQEAAAAGSLDREAVAAVLEVAGHRPARVAWPAGLTDREVEVLRLLARGQTRNEIAANLFISPSTVHTHTLHVYEKTSVSTRAAVALFAMEHDLLHA